MGMFTLSLTRSLLVSLNHRCCYMQDSNDLMLLYLSVLSETKISHANPLNLSVLTELNLVLLALSPLPSSVQHSARSSDTLFASSLNVSLRLQRKGGSSIRTEEGTSPAEPGPTQLGDSCQHTHRC